MHLALSDALLTRFGREKNKEDLNNAILQLNKLLELPSPEHSDEKFTHLGRCVQALCTRFRYVGERTDLDEAIKRYGEAQVILTPGNQSHHTTLSRLASLIGGSFGQISDHNSVLGVHPQVHSDPVAYVKFSLTAKEFHTIKVTESPIGIGGSCEVLLGQHRPSQMKLALKRPRLLASGSLDALRRFQREAKLWSKFEHPNILPFLGILELSDYIYLVSPWVSLGDLPSVIRKHLAYSEGADEPFTPEELAAGFFSEGRTIRDIAAGLAYLHSLNVVHGDLKGTNVLCSENGRALLCDFGMTKAMDTLSCAITSSAMKGAGTLRWQSPELFLSEPKTFASDVYAFSMVIVEVLTGKPPLPHLGDVAFVNRVLNHNERSQWEPLSRRGRDFTTFWRIASRCWVTEATERPHIEEILEELLVLEGLGILDGSNMLGEYILNS